MKFWPDLGQFTVGITAGGPIIMALALEIVVKLLNAKIRFQKIDNFTNFFEKTNTSKFKKFFLFHENEIF